jgi:hypothetical protein
VKREQEDTNAIPVWPDMREAFALFCDAPWNWVAMGMGGVVRTGILRTELEASARLLGVTPTPDLFADVRVMENAAMAYWAERRR